MAAPDGVGPAGAWWLPARSVTLTESWDPDPDRLPPGASVRRTLVIEAAGTIAERLPPPPDMRATGITALPGPVARETIVTEDGPTARATYVWDIRPNLTGDATAPAIRVPWFDTSARVMREATRPARSLSGFAGRAGTTHTPNPWRGFAGLWPMAIGGAGWSAALVTLVTLRRRPRSRSRLTAQERATLAALRRAARRDDAGGVRAGLLVLARADPRRWCVVASQEGVDKELIALDVALYGPAGLPHPALGPLARRVIAALALPSSGTYSRRPHQTEEKA